MQLQSQHQTIHHNNYQIYLYQDSNRLWSFSIAKNYREIDSGHEFPHLLAAREVAIDIINNRTQVSETE